MYVLSVHLLFPYSSRGLFNTYLIYFTPIESVATNKDDDDDDDDDDLSQPLSKSKMSENK